MSKIRDLINTQLDEGQIDKLSTSLTAYFENCINNCKPKTREGFIDLTNLYLYEHGLISEKGLKDYILTDFLESNRFLVKNKIVPNNLFDETILDLDIDSEFDIIGKKKLSYFDVYKEFVAVNVLSINNPELAKEIVRKADIMMDRKFFRILSYYSALYCIHLIIKKDEETSEERIEEYNCKLDKMFEIYEDFTIFTPNWAIK